MGGSGSHGERRFQQVDGVHGPTATVSWQVEGRTVLRFALAYGFRNIQTLLRKVKPGLSPYDYVEVMACPSGCINVGGQLPHPPGLSMQESIARVDAAYHHPQVRPLPLPWKQHP